MSDLSLTVTLALIVARACDIREKSFNRGIAQQISAEHQSSKSIFAKMDEEALIKKLEGAYTVTISEAAGQASREHKEPLLAASLGEVDAVVTDTAVRADEVFALGIGLFSARTGRLDAVCAGAEPAIRKTLTISDKAAACSCKLSAAAAASSTSAAFCWVT